MFNSLLHSPNIASEPLSAKTALANANAGKFSAFGQYAVAWEHDGSVVLLRDPLGCNKLFYGLTKQGDLIASNRIDEAMEAGVNLDELASCPPGHVVVCRDNVCRIVGGCDISSYSEDPEFEIGQFRATLNERLEQAFRHLSVTFKSHRVYVCLSGGLDSSTVLKLAADFFTDVVAVSFSYLSDPDLERLQKGADVTSLSSRSADFVAAQSVAEAVGVELVPVFRSRSAVAEVANETISLCQDWRDFNVHCAVVNRFLAEAIQLHAADTPAVVMTGDLMNEYVCDYREETFEGTVYYPQPRVSIGKRRRFFVRGLDAGDREIGVFNAYGLKLLQPFSFVPDLYMSVPPAILEKPDAKEYLNGHLLGDGLLDHVSKVKQRAQVGGSDGGTLGIFHQMKFDQARLLQVWESELPSEYLGRAPEEIIQFGRYRTSPLSGSE